MSIPNDVGRATVPDLLAKLETDNIPHCCDCKDHMVAIVWAFALNISLPDFHVGMRSSKDNLCGVYNRCNISLLKQEIYRRMSGIPGSLPGLQNIAQIKRQDVLIAISLYLDTAGVGYGRDIKYKIRNPLPKEKWDAALAGFSLMALAGKEEVRDSLYYNSQLEAQVLSLDEIPVQFGRFMHLPPELQRMVWEFTLLWPRIVQFYTQRYPFKCTAPLPSIMHVCSSSRDVGLRGYRKFNIDVLSIPGYPLWEGAVYFNPEIDTVYLGPRSFEFRERLSLWNGDYCAPFDHAHIKHFAYTDWKFLPREVRELIYWLTKLPNLKTVTWILKDKDISLQPYTTEFFDERTHDNVNSDTSLSKEQKKAVCKNLNHLKDLFIEMEKERSLEDTGVETFRVPLPEFRVARARIHMAPQIQWGDDDDHQDAEDGQDVKGGQNAEDSQNAKVNNNINTGGGLEGLAKHFDKFGQLDSEDLQELDELEDIEDSDDLQQHEESAEAEDGNI